MPDIIKEIETMKKFLIFENLSISVLQGISSISVKQEFVKDEIIIRQGDINSSIYLILSGKVRIIENFNTKKEKITMTLSSGAFFGELNVFTSFPYETTIIAEETTTVNIIEKSKCMELIRIYPDLGINFCEFFATRLEVKKIT